VNATELRSMVDATRRTYAGAVHTLLRLHNPTPDLSYDGDYTVTTGPVRVHFASNGVEVSFTDPYSDDAAPLVLRITGVYTLGAVTAVVEALLTQLTTAVAS
jgi:hypothetical protein